MTLLDSLPSDDFSRLPPLQDSPVLYLLWRHAAPAIRVYYLDAQEEQWS